MLAANYDFSVEQSATFKFNLQLTDNSGSAVDITGWEFVGNIKETPNVANPPVATFTIDVLDVPSALVEVTLPASEADKLIKTRYVYDIIAKNNTVVPMEVYRLLEGKITVDLAVTGLS